MKKINMGCGKRNFGCDWIHIDGGDYEHLDHDSITDLSKFENESIDLIYASHVIEYFDRQDVQPLLIEWKSKLRPGGTLRLAVPNFEQMCKAYSSGDFGLDSFLGPLYGRMEMGDEMIYHKTAYDYKELFKVLNNIGFKNIKKYRWQDTKHSCIDDHSQAYLPHMDKKNGILISLNVECVR